MEKTGLEKSTIINFYKAFETECPNGSMTKKQFVKMTKVVILSGCSP